MSGFNSTRYDSSISGAIGQTISSNGNFTSPGDATSSRYILRVVTSDATPTPLLSDGVTATAKPTLLANQTLTFSAFISCRDSSGNSGGYVLRGVIKRGSTAASTTLVGTVDKTVLAEDVATWDVSATVDTTNGALNINAIGAAATNIRWLALVTTAEVVF